MTRRIAVTFVMALALVSCAKPKPPAAESTRSPATTASGASSLQKAHDFTLRTFSGGTFRLSEHFGQLPVVLNFWAPW